MVAGVVGLFVGAVLGGGLGNELVGAAVGASALEAALDLWWTRRKERPPSRRLARVMIQPRSSSLLVSCVAGVLGGGLVTAAILVVAVAGGRFDSSRKTVTVQEAPIASADATQGTRGLTAHQIYERDSPGVVFVSATGVNEVPSAAELVKGEGGEQGTATGSGFEINGEGMILTNSHVVEGASKITVSFDEHGETVNAVVLGKDSSHDVAVLHVPTEGLTLHPLVLGDSSNVQVGEPVLAIGNPFGYSRTLTTGGISARQRQIQAPNGVNITNVLQTDAPINPGSSGGPLLNTRGQVIGINSQIVTSAGNGGSVGIAFAIPIDTAKSELLTLERGRG
jgi:S1-C subfamily serine protease